MRSYVNEVPQVGIIQGGGAAFGGGCSEGVDVEQGRAALGGGHLFGPATHMYQGAAVRADAVPQAGIIQVVGAALLGGHKEGEDVEWGRAAFGGGHPLGPTTHLHQGAAMCEAHIIQGGGASLRVNSTQVNFHITLSTRQNPFKFEVKFKEDASFRTVVMAAV